VFWSHFDDQSLTTRDGLPRTELFAAMSADELNRIEGQLLARLGDSSNFDDWVPMVLAHLKSDRAVPALRARLGSSNERYRVAVAEALWKLTREAGAVEHIIDILHPRGLLKRFFARLDSMSSERVAAVVALGGINTPESREAIKRALDDHNFFVRANARTSELRSGSSDRNASRS
jgi:HEAT repeat protein